jgi:hypothetical protein
MGKRKRLATVTVDKGAVLFCPFYGVPPIWFDTDNDSVFMKEMEGTTARRLGWS